MISEVGRANEKRGLKRIGMLGTRMVMETRSYGGIASAEIISPSGLFREHWTFTAAHRRYAPRA